MKTHRSKLSSLTPLLKLKYNKTLKVSSSSSIKLQLNKFPLSKISHRAMPPLYVSKPRHLSIHQQQQKLKKFFSVANLDQRALATKILGQRENNSDAIIENHDSFNGRYSPTKHKFYHKIIAKIKNLTLQFDDRSSQSSLNKQNLHL